MTPGAAVNSKKIKKSKINYINFNLLVMVKTKY